MTLAPSSSTEVRGLPCMIGLDIGGTKMVCCVVTSDGKVHASVRRPTEASRGGAVVADDAYQLVQSMCEAAKSVELAPTSLGISICELVDAEGHIVSDHTIAWRDKSILERFNELLPTVAEADCRAAATAEARFGAGRDFKILLYVTVGTGISCSLVIDGSPYKGARGATGTMATGSLSTICNSCRQLGISNLEEASSGTGLALRYRLGARQAALCEGQSDDISAEQIMLRARDSDAIAQRVLTEGATCLGSAVAQLVNVLDPEAVIIGGGLGAAPGHYWETLVSTTRRHIWSDTHRALPILQGSLGDHAAAIGAALFASERADFRS